MDAWHKEYEWNKDEYIKLFDEVMQEKQEQNIEFLEKTITNTIHQHMQEPMLPVQKQH